MNEKEAHRILNPETTMDALAEIRYHHGFRGREAEVEYVEEACRVACTALQKQIPQKPVQQQGFPRWGYCPSCGKTVTKHSSYVGCTWCLQRLDWSE